MGPVDILLRYPLFALLGRPLLEAWAECGRSTTLQPGQAILEEGQRGRYVCVVLAGQVRLSRTTAAGRERTLGVLKAGTVFGEYALLPPHANTATCRASEPCRVMLLPLTLIQAALQSVRGLPDHLKNWLRLHAVVHHFRHSAGMGFLTGPSLLTLLDRGREVSIGVAHTVQAEGLLSDGWLFIQRGEVLLHAEGAESRQLGPGDCLGEAALLGRSRLPTAVALSETVCWHLPREDFYLPFDGIGSEPRQTLKPVARDRSWEWLGQRGPADCGVAALAMALRGLGLEVTFEELAARAPAGPHGTSLADLAQAAHQVGARAVAVRVGLEQLPLARLPAVAHLTGGHYVTLFEVRANKLVLGDPAEGIRAVTPAAFRRDWSGNLLLLRARSVPAPPTS